MTSEDELRAKVAVASCDDLHRFNVVPGVACTDCQRHADALLPVIREHLVQATWRIENQRDEARMQLFHANRLLAQHGIKPPEKP